MSTVFGVGVEEMKRHWEQWEAQTARSSQMFGGSTDCTVVETYVVKAEVRVGPPH